MNALPAHRRILHGRTHSRIWSASDYDPISMPPRRRPAADVILAIVLGIFAALFIVHALAS